jgi:hypothetical protein
MGISDFRKGLGKSVPISGCRAKGLKKPADNYSTGKKRACKSNSRLPGALFPGFFT